VTLAPAARAGKPQNIAMPVAVRAQDRIRIVKWPPRKDHDHADPRADIVRHLFSIAVAGIFLNRKNVIVLLMCIELMCSP